MMQRLSTILLFKYAINPFLAATNIPHLAQPWNRWIILSSALLSAAATGSKRYHGNISFYVGQAVICQYSIFLLTLIFSSLLSESIATIEISLLFRALSPDDDITWFISALPSRETAPMYTQQWCLLMLSFIDQRLHRSSINACASAPFPRPPPWQFSPPNCTTRPTFVTACAEMNCRV